MLPDELDPRRVLDRARLGRDVVEGDAVLRDDDRDPPVVVRDPHEVVVEALRPDPPPLLRVVLADELGRIVERPVLVRGVPQPVRHVVAVAEEIDAVRKDFTLLVADLRDDHALAAVPVDHVGRVVALQKRVEEPARVVAVVAVRGRLVLRAVGGAVRRGVGHLRVELDAHLRLRVDPCERGFRAAVREEEVVAHADRGGEVVQPRRVTPEPVADPGDDPRFGVADPDGDPLAQCLEHRPRVALEVIDDLGICPAAAVLQRLREVPVVERSHGGDAGLADLARELAVPVESFLIEPAGLRPVGVDPRPADREAVGSDVELFHERDVFVDAVVVVAGDVAGVSVGDVTRDVTKSVPDRLALAPLRPRAFDLVARRGRAPVKVVWKTVRHGITSRLTGDVTPSTLGDVDEPLYNMIIEEARGGA